MSMIGYLTTMRFVYETLFSAVALHNIQVTLGLISIKCNNVLLIIKEPLRVSANDGN
jgi:hypothetical protein